MSGRWGGAFVLHSEAPVTSGPRTTTGRLPCSGGGGRGSGGRSAVAASAPPPPPPSPPRNELAVDSKLTFIRTLVRAVTSISLRFRGTAAAL